MNTEQRVAEMKRRLESAFQPVQLEIVDEGHLHAGHEGAKDGRGHFRLHIVSDHFRDLGMLQRHRLVYQALGELLETDIHALSIDARAAETQAPQSDAR